MLSGLHIHYLHCNHVQIGWNDLVGLCYIANEYWAIRKTDERRGERIFHKGVDEPDGKLHAQRHRYLSVSPAPSPSHGPISRTSAEDYI